MEIVMNFIGLLGSRKHGFSAFMLAISFRIFALVVGSAEVSIVAAHFDLMQIGRTSFDIATYSAGRACLILAMAFFWIGLLATAFQSIPTKPRK